jgi:hypothetical protein
LPYNSRCGTTLSSGELGIGVTSQFPAAGGLGVVASSHSAWLQIGAAQFSPSVNPVSAVSRGFKFLSEEEEEEEFGLAAFPVSLLLGGEVGPARGEDGKCKVGGLGVEQGRGSGDAGGERDLARAAASNGLKNSSASG